MEKGVIFENRGGAGNGEGATNGKGGGATNWTSAGGANGNGGDPESPSGIQNYLI